MYHYNVIRRPMNKTHVIYPDFLSDEENKVIFREALLLQEVFQQSYVIKNAVGSSLEENTRKSFVIKTIPDSLRTVLLTQVKNKLPEVLQQLQIGSFDPDKYEVQLTVHNDGHFYKPHSDNGSPQNQKRVITFVYYFHSLPKAFSGGDLLILTNPPHIIQPQNNSIVFFDSSLLHSVHPVQCPDKKFEHGRFTLNGWIWR